MKYYWLRYKDNTGNANGYAKGLVITINSKHKGNEALLEHEKTHVRQWWALAIPSVIAFVTAAPYLHELAFILLGAFALTGHNLLYTVSKRYRLYSEVQAFTNQLNMQNGVGIYNAAKAIAENYNLDVDFDTALKLLRRRTKRSIP